MPSHGTASSAFDIPLIVGLLGAVLQMAPVEFDASGGITAVTISNALTLTIGWF